MAREAKRLPVATTRIIGKLFHWARQGPEGVADLRAHELIRLLRGELSMTQAQLAKRCGLPQSHIARIESGKIDLQLETVRRIFSALSCGLAVVPIPSKSPEEIVREQARKAALKRVRRVAASMALEEQRPDERMLEELIKAETEKLLSRRASAIWEDE